jgi:malonyl CoA-acyl carrier protein transacylase
MSTIYLFPGQGSQAKGMGTDLFTRYPQIVATADAELGYSMRALCVDDPQEQLGNTRYTQPALFTVNALMWMARLETGESKPDATAGHSLGEYNALLAAGVFDFATGLKLVKKRAELMSQATGGGMAAVLGLEAEAVIKALKGGGLDRIDVANFNSPAQTVISGPKEWIAPAAERLTAVGAKRVVPLNVSGAFHSRYLAPAATQFGEFLKGFTFHAPLIPVIANCHAQPYTQETVAANLTKQICSSVRWVDCIRRLRQLPQPEFVEVGPGRVLAGLLRTIN